jgi:hypothetical protein
MIQEKPKTKEEHETHVFRQKFDHNCRNLGVRKAISAMKDHNAKLDASKERAKQTVHENIVSNLYRSGVRDTCISLMGYDLPTLSWEEIQRHAGRHVYLATPAGLIERSR